MKLPRDISGRQLAKALRVFGYATTASHIRLTTLEQGEQHLTIPDHPSLRIGTLSAILSAVAEHFGMTRERVAEQLFD
jgi:hypothetical protein